MDDKRFLLSLIKEGEHQQQDFKYRVADACKLAKSVSAFANTDGGRLLIGVRDDGHLSGVRSEEEIYMMHQAAYKYCQPEASIKFDTYHAVSSDSANATPCLRTIVVATVPPSTKRPICAIDSEGRKRAYVRINDEYRRNLRLCDKEINDTDMKKVAEADAFAHDKQERQQVLSATVERFFDKLSPRQQQIINLYYIEQRKYDDICQIMGINYQSVRNLMHRSIMRLRSLAETVDMAV